MISRRPARRGPGRPPGPSQAPKLRARLVDEASRLYADGGYAGLSFARVAERAGLTKPTVFHYFPNKEALLLGMFEAFGERLERAAQSWFDPPPASYAARLERLVGSLIDFYGREPLNARILCHGLLEGERFAARRGRGMPAATQRFVTSFADFIAGGIAAGEFHPARPLAVVMAIGGIILFEFMLPDQGEAFRDGPDGQVGLDGRGAEIAALIERAVVRPRARFCAPARRAQKGVVVKTIDADGHVIEPADLWERELPASLRGRGFAVRWNADSRQEEVHLDGNLFLPWGIVGVGLAGRPFDDVGKGVRYSELMPGGFDPRLRLRDMDSEGIDTAVLYPSIGLFLEAIEDAALAEASCRVYNDWLADYCRTAPERLIGVAAMPMQDVGAAVRELERAAGDLGMRGVFIRPNPCRGRALHDPYFDPFWHAAAEIGVAVGLHPSGTGDLPGALQGLRLDAPIMGHPSIFFIDAFIGFSHMVCGGVLERHPKLTVVVLEAGGGWLAHWFDRFDHFAEVYKWMAPDLRLKPSEYFKRQCYVSFDPDETTLPLLAPLIGEDRIVWASDYPHLDATFPGVVRELDEHLLKLPAAARDKVRGANAAKLYGLNT